MNRNNLRGISALIVVIVLLLIAASALNSALQRQSAPAEGLTAPLTQRWNPKMVEILSFGHLAVTSDWIWIKGLLDPTATHVEKGKRADLFYHADLVTELDPMNYFAYVTGATLLTIIRNDNDGALELLMKGRAFDREKLSSYPQEFRERFWGRKWNLYITLAYVYLFELNDMPKASQAFQEAAQIPGSPSYLQKLVERFKRPGGEYEVGIRLLDFMISQSESDEAKSKLERKKLHLYVAQYRHEIDGAFREFLSKQPQYRSKLRTLTRAEMESLWTKFLRENRGAARDPWGGALSPDPETGKIVTTTPYEKVFGLD